MTVAQIDSTVIVELLNMLSRFRTMAQMAAGGTDVTNVAMCWGCGRAVNGSESGLGCTGCDWWINHPNISVLNSLAKGPDETPTAVLKC